MHYVLNIETATTMCSVSVSKNGVLVFCKEVDNGFTHAENLHLFISGVVAESNISVKDLSAVAISKGPGSYTGLRIGVSAAKGLAYGLGIPLISIDTMQLMSAGAKEAVKENAFYCPMIDARRMEVYTSVYDGELNQHSSVEALIVDENSVLKFKDYPAIYFFGDGMPKCRTILQTLPNAAFIDGMAPSSQFMAGLSYQKFTEKEFENVAYFEPFYLKDFLITHKKP